MDGKKFFLLVAVIVILAIVATNSKALAAQAKKLVVPDGAGRSPSAGSGSNGSGSATGSTGTSGGSSTGGTAATGLVGNKVLRQGMVCAEVKELQSYLNQLNSHAASPSAPLVEDGNFGSKTLAMLKKYYSNNTSATLDAFKVYVYAKLASGGY